MGLDLVVGEEGREEATMDREKVVGLVLKTRKVVGRKGGSGRTPMGSRGSRLVGREIGRDPEEEGR